MLKFTNMPIVNEDLDAEGNELRLRKSTKLGELAELEEFREDISLNEIKLENQNNIEFNNSKFGDLSNTFNDESMLNKNSNVFNEKKDTDKMLNNKYASLKGKDNYKDIFNYNNNNNIELEKINLTSNKNRNKNEINYFSNPDINSNSRKISKNTNIVIEELCPVNISIPLKPRNLSSISDLTKLNLSKNYNYTYAKKGFNNFELEMNDDRKYNSDNLDKGRNYFKYKYISENFIKLNNQNEIKFNKIDKIKGSFIINHAPDDVHFIKLNTLYHGKLEKSIFLFNLKFFENCFNQLVENILIKSEEEFAELLLISNGFDKTIIGEFL